MQITNFSFLFLFLPLALLLAFLTRKHLRAQNTALLALSLAFYACSELRGLSVLLALSFAVWLLARLRGRGWQTLGIVVCIAALCYFKYTGFLTDNWNRLTGLNAAIPTIAAPSSGEVSRVVIASKGFPHATEKMTPQMTAMPGA